MDFSKFNLYNIFTEIGLAYRKLSPFLFRKANNRKIKKFIKLKHLSLRTEFKTMLLFVTINL